MFENLNSYKNLQVIASKSYQELQQMIVQIKAPIQIINIVTNNGEFICFFICDSKITINKKG